MSLEWLWIVESVLFWASIIWVVILWFKGVLAALIRLGNGLAKRKLAIFAKGNNLISITDSLHDSGLFSKRNIISISSKGDIGKAEKATLFLVYWPDWQNDIDSILTEKEDGTALIVYAPQELGFIPPAEIKKLNEKRNVIVANFRGRLLNDVVISMITTSYKK